MNTTKAEKSAGFTNNSAGFTKKSAGFTENSVVCGWKPDSEIGGEEVGKCGEKSADAVGFSANSAEFWRRRDAFALSSYAQYPDG